MKLVDVMREDEGYCLLAFMRQVEKGKARDLGKGYRLPYSGADITNNVAEIVIS